MGQSRGENCRLYAVWRPDRAWRLSTDVSQAEVQGGKSSRQYRPDSDDDEARAGDQLQGARLDEALELRADQDADRGSDDQRGRATREDNPFVGLAVGGKEHRCKLGLVTNFREKNGHEYC